LLGNDGHGYGGPGARLGLFRLWVAAKMNLRENFPCAFPGILRFYSGRIPDSDATVLRPNPVLHDPGALSARPQA
jgi:hypothetical protein